MGGRAWEGISTALWCFCVNECALRSRIPTRYTVVRPGLGFLRATHRRGFVIRSCPLPALRVRPLSDLSTHRPAAFLRSYVLPSRHPRPVHTRQTSYRPTYTSGAVC